MDVNYLEKLRKEEIAVEGVIGSLKKQREEIDDKIYEAHNLINRIHTQASEQIFGVKD